MILSLLMRVIGLGLGEGCPPPRIFLKSGERRIVDGCLRVREEENRLADYSIHPLGFAWIFPFGTARFRGSWEQEDSSERDFSYAPK